MKEGKNKIGKRIKLIRQELKLKQSELAKEINISATTISEIETGKINPGFDFLVNLSKKLNVNLYYLLFGQGEMFIDPVISLYTQQANYAVNPDLVKNFLYYFRHSRQVQYFTMNEFERKMMNPEEAESILREVKAFEKKNK